MLFFQLPVLPKLWLKYGGGIEWLFTSWSPSFQPEPGMYVCCALPFNGEHTAEYLASVLHTFRQPGVVSNAIAYYRYVPLLTELRHGYISLLPSVLQQAHL